MITISVASGSGSASFDFGHIRGESISLISPDNTPMYNFSIHDSDGMFLVGADGISAQKTKIVEDFHLRGVCTLQITEAVDDGDYKISIFQK